jgi:hypothetical protein
MSKKQRKGMKNKESLMVPREKKAVGAIAGQISKAITKKLSRDYSDLKLLDKKNELTETFLKDHNYKEIDSLTDAIKKEIKEDGASRYIINNDGSITAYTSVKGSKQGFEKKTFKNPTLKSLRKWMGYNEGGEVMKKESLMVTPSVAITIFDKEETRSKKSKGGFPDLTGDGEVTQADVLKGRGVFQEGGMPEEQDMPVDTYPNIPPEEMAEVEASQLPDEQMEENYLDYIVDQSLNEDDQQYLMNTLEADPRLSQIFDRVVGTASEFSGAGMVEGPGTGVSDSIPARLSDGEFVITRKATDAIGADNLQRMMDDAERASDSGQTLQMAFGGQVDEDEIDETSSKDYLSKTDEEIRKVMIGSNRMPSVR